MRQHSLVFRMALLQQALAAALIVVFSGSAIWLTGRTLERQELNNLTNTAERIAGGIGREWREEQDLARGARAALEEDHPEGITLEVFDARGGKVYSSGTRQGLPPREERRQVRTPIADGGWVIATSSTRRQRSAMEALGMALLLTGIPLFVIVTAASRTVARRALRPLSRMAAEAELASESGIVTTLGRPGDPAEIENLSESFRRLLARLERVAEAERHFTNDAAHELRTPLTVVSGELEYALASPDLAERHRSGLRSAEQRVRALSDLVEALLLLRRADPPHTGMQDEFVPVNLGDLVRETGRELLNTTPERAKDLQIEAEDEILVAGHGVLLGSAIRNLLSNALKFTRPGERVEVEVFAEDSACCVVVEDAGRGIAPDQRERVFDPFYRDPEARASHDGFGLGLHILRQVARAHGGEVVALESVLGGARFELRLPAWAPRA